MPLQVVPLTNAPNATTSVTLSIDNTLVQVTIITNFNAMANYWMMSIFDVYNTPLITLVPMLTGLYPAANLLVQQQYLKIGAWFIVNVGNDPNDYPDQTNLGSSFQLWVDDTPPVLSP
jgi:hypothetical protein